ncbi:hypothetical protein GWI33_009528 [Rhynchophorus ferrugineus]|uniref:Uncharacterized protein n=1 Tax=Rhynchophorus ferrugineus TaxID=354439 RepID=A0A834MJW2_RHYFE|nr:hypothetical protein GWI33_009528 [Rhynchophorus ferrugineus]
MFGEVRDDEGEFFLFARYLVQFKVKKVVVQVDIKLLLMRKSLDARTPKLIRFESLEVGTTASKTGTDLIGGDGSLKKYYQKDMSS